MSVTNRQPAFFTGVTAGVSMFLLALLFGAPGAVAGDAVSPAGHWEGAITLPGTELAIRVDLEQTQDAWAGTIDIPAQGLRGFPLGDLDVTDDSVVFVMPNIPGDPIFDGKLGDDGKAITGDFSQNGQTFPFKLEQKPKTEIEGETPSKGIPGEGLPGVWQGSLLVNAFELRLLFKFEMSDDDQFVGTLDSLDQGAKDIPVSKIVADGQQLHLEIRAIGAVFDGKMNGDGSEIVGEFVQGGQTLPLTVRRLAKAPDLSRPQDPKEPYPYHAEDVVFDNADADVKLAGTLTFPNTPGPHPAVVLISGSGPQDRNETLMGHRPFLVLADHLTRQGIAVLRYDDRGFGESTGNFSEATTTDFTSDALAAVAYLKSRQEIDPSRIGLIGHSEGGLVAPQAAVQSDDVDFIVLLAGPGVPMDELLARQAADLMRLTGMDEKNIAKQIGAQREVFRIVIEEGDSPDAAEKIKTFLEALIEEYTPEQLAAMGFSESQIDGQVKTVLSPWFRGLLATDPGPTLQRVKCPVLAINGAKDIQIASADNLAGIKAALAKGGNADVTVIEFPDLNHLFQHSTTGSISE